MSDAGRRKKILIRFFSGLIRGLMQEFCRIFWSQSHPRLWCFIQNTSSSPVWMSQLMKLATYTVHGLFIQTQWLQNPHRRWIFVLGVGSEIICYLLKDDDIKSTLTEMRPRRIEFIVMFFFSPLASILQQKLHASNVDSLDGRMRLPSLHRVTVLPIT